MSTAQIYKVPESGLVGGATIEVEAQTGWPRLSPPIWDEPHPAVPAHRSTTPSPRPAVLEASKLVGALSLDWPQLGPLALESRPEATNRPEPAQRIDNSVSEWPRATDYFREMLELLESFNDTVATGEASSNSPVATASAHTGQEPRSRNDDRGSIGRHRIDEVLKFIERPTPPARRAVLIAILAFLVAATILTSGILIELKGDSTDSPAGAAVSGQT